MFAERVDPPVLSEQEARAVLDNWPVLYALAGRSRTDTDLLQAALSHYNRVQRLVYRLHKLPTQQPLFVLPGAWALTINPHFGSIHGPDGRLCFDQFPQRYRDQLDALGIVAVAAALLQIESATSYLQALADNGHP